MEEIKDHFGRTFKTLRISLINTCNLACTYCSYSNDDDQKNNAVNKGNNLKTKELTDLIIRLHERLNLGSIRFTGGEPLLYKELPALIEGVRKLGITDLNLTTNGLLLQKQASALKAAGLTAINVSLDATDPLTFFMMARRHGLEQTLKGIDAALHAGITVKINSVIMKGLNENQVIPLLKYAADQQLIIRFLEIMAMGHLHGKADDYFFSQAEILKLISTRHRFTPVQRTKSATANYWQTEAGHIFGIIANESQPFCTDCDRLRLDAYGNIYGCLSSNQPISIRDISDPALLDLSLKEALKQKQTIKFTGSKLSMLHIGG
ncbi:GTP 3',8-cyclase MoaA [Pedobacter caeni]|uniref:Cyclic pyranopterin phosphate synthase n=1 Tax=Pedobacter caeni TaxID=288992 RepID=A0A1M4U2K3_9SPHI|nr:GTP 3',8-cyclase MoaA [Pedobacter caeni]SHE50854.1 cyclic pyranopterin phosphate synthase [Pedobacter caeni]